MYYCPECGEEENFVGTQTYTDYGTRDVYLDNEGGIIEYGDGEISDSENDDITDIVCDSCGEEIVNYYNESELRSLRIAFLNVKSKTPKNWRKKLE